MIAKGITRALTKHRVTFLYATNDKRSWKQRIGKGRTEVLQVAGYEDEDCLFIDDYSPNIACGKEIGF